MIRLTFNNKFQIKLSLTVCFVFCYCLLGYSQEFEFKKYKNDKPKYVESGTRIHVYLKSQDTTHAMSGFLKNLDDSLLSIDVYYEQLWMHKKEHSYDENFTYNTSKYISVPISSIDYIELDRGFLPGAVSDGFGLIGIAST